MKIIKNVLLGILFTILMTSASQGEESVTDYTDLVSLFREFREFTKPNSIEIGVPDYTAAAMQKQWQELKTYQKRLVAIDTSDWPISKKVDYQIVRAEMNALEFNHRVLRPWSKDPGFYSVIPRFEQNMYGAIIIPKLPLSEDKIDDFQVKLRAIPKVLEQAKENLTEAASDLAILAIKRNEKDSNKFILNVKDLDLLDTYGAQLLNDLAASIQGSGGKCVICGAAKIVHDLLEVFPSKNTFEFYETEKEALESFKE